MHRVLKYPEKADDIWITSWADRWGCLFVFLLSLISVLILYFDVYTWGLMHEMWREYGGISVDEGFVVMNVLHLSLITVRYTLDVLYGILFYKMVKLIRESEVDLSFLKCQVYTFFTICLVTLLIRDTTSVIDWAVFALAAQKDDTQTFPDNR